MTLSTDLEPAERDPKRLRRTAWTLVIIMIAGGWFITMAYEKMAVHKSKDTRPAVVQRLVKMLEVRRQDGKTVDLLDLRGHVWVIHTLSESHPESGRLSLEVMRRLAAKYANHPDFNLVSLVVEPQDNGGIATQASLADSHGFHLPQWWLCTGDPKTLHPYIKNELKTSTFPHEEDGSWQFDTSIVLVDRDCYLRQAVVPQKIGGLPYIARFDFDEAAEWDSQGKKTGTERTNAAELELLLEKTIDTLLVETEGNP